MKKLFLLGFVCLFAFALTKPCMAQDWTDYYYFKHLDVSWNWGNSDIPQPDFSRFPPRPTSMDSPSWTGLVVADGLDLSGRDLRNARIHLLGGTLRNVNFDGANLEGAVFCEVVLESCSFRGTNLRHTRIIPSHDCDMTNAIIGGVAGFLTEEQMLSTWNFKNRDFSNTNFYNCNFPDLEYDSSFNFRGTNFFAASHGFFFCCPDSLSSQFRPAIQAFPRRINFEDFSLEQLPKELWGTPDRVFRTHEFRQKSLHGLIVEGMNFAGRDFSGFTLGIFENCDFHDANFDGAMRIMPQSTRWRVDPKIKFGFRQCHITEKQLAQTHFWKRGDLVGIVLDATSGHQSIGEP